MQPPQAHRGLVSQATVVERLCSIPQELAVLLWEKFFGGAHLQVDSYERFSKLILLDMRGTNRQPRVTLPPG